MELLNLGCGTWYHVDWINIDFKSAGPHVITRNLRKGIPFAKETCDYVATINNITEDVIKKYVQEQAEEDRKNGIYRGAFYWCRQ